MFIKNKKATDKVLSIYWFAILVIIAGAVFAMVTMFYGYPYDVRNIESNIMINKVSDCISPSGFFNKSLLSQEDFSLTSYCNITFDVENSLYSDKGNYYLQATFYNFTNSEKLFALSEGNPSFKADCNINNGDYEKLAVCVNRTFYSIDYSNNPYEINVLSIVTKTDKNVE